MKFSTSPAVEVTMATGIRPTLGRFDFDIGAAYYYYPGELGPDLSNYWEAHATVSHKLTEKLTLGATLAYAPDVWQSGAWGTYAAGALSLDLPTELLPTGVSWALSADFGRSVFGPTSSAGGVSAGGAGLPLPAYNNWRAGLTFSYNVFKLGLNYTDTTLSKEHCYVMTGDLGAIPGGVEHSRQSDRIALTSVRRDILGNARVRNQSCDARTLAPGRARRAIQDLRFSLQAGFVAHFATARFA